METHSIYSLFRFAFFTQDNSLEIHSICSVSIVHSFHCDVDILQSVQSIGTGVLGHFWFGAIRNKAQMNIYAEVFMST